MSTIRILLGIFCLIAIGSSALSSSRVLAQRGCELGVTSYRTGCLNGCALPVTSYRSRYLNNLQLNAQPHNPQRVTHNTKNTILNIARSQIGVREATGNNDGTQVEAYLKVTNLPKGNAWCAAFISWVFKQAGFDKPRTAWSPALFPTARRTLNPQPADVLGIYSQKLKRIAHAGLVERRQNNWIIAVEGNTNADGSRDGDGVYRKWRHLKTIKYFANWQKGGLK